ncbi:unnamed protein product [Penicillium salamii]|uniref:AB hydrolase-1 domain-containing protein n=1 Tax=Penicillium salamii TaxID=1612424 RepID=A0A9W4N792_9EURO|nr:unnamed protein product [Penicillium salamii]CAG8032155.1 unnamed protein product [Penicillium salamii]CAG8201621.1 unnamed protein product [Penicillium salamii]CAG8210425.1 unnamed protein product [Penicillium salamii]CAG8216047.1 unnamed protein product [Penicillium salamii]
MTRMAFPFQVSEHVIDAQHVRDSAQATATPDAKLKLCIKQYTPLDNINPQPGDITIIGTHGTGFPKELYEPLWEELLARANTEGFRVRSIWIADCVNQGASGILNEKQLGSDLSWADLSRDLIHMVNHFRDQMPQPIMGIGHSLGATQLCVPLSHSQGLQLTLSSIFASLMHPRLLSSIILIEPYIAVAPRIKEGSKMMALATFRRDTWHSHTEAVQKARKVFKTWDERVLQRWAQFAYRKLPTAIHPSLQPGSVTLATSKHQELVTYTYIRPRVHKPVILPGDKIDQGAIDALPKRQIYRSEPLLAMKLIPHVAPSVLIVSGATSSLYKDGSHASGAHAAGTEFGGNGGMDVGEVRHEVIDEAGHSVPFEKIAATASVAASWIACSMRKWQDNQDKLVKEWGGLSLKEKTTFPREWLELAGNLPGFKERPRL